MPGPLSSQEQDPDRLLEEAERLAWLNNWDKAGPLYKRAEAFLSQSGDRRRLMLAKIGHIQASMQGRFLPDLSHELAKDLENPIIQNDPGLKLRWLVAKAEV